MSTVATAKLPATQSAQTRARQAEDTHWRAISRTRMQIERTRQDGQAELQLQEAAQALPTDASHCPMPRLGAFRCKMKKCKNCSVDICKASSDEGRADSSCPCYQAQRCTYWDDKYACMISYDEAPPTQTAIKAWCRVPRNPEPSIASSVSTVTPEPATQRDPDTYKGSRRLPAGAVCANPSDRGGGSVPGCNDAGALGAER